MTGHKTKCAIWKTEAVEYDPVPGGRQFDSPRAGGKYRISDTVSAIGSFQNMNTAEKARLTTWIVNQHRSGILSPMITSDIVEMALNAQPINFSDKKRRFFEYLHDSRNKIGQTIRFEFHDTRAPQEIDINNKYIISSWIESVSDQETESFIFMMIDLNYIKRENHYSISVTASGWHALDEFQSSNLNTNQVFVAMWFGGKTKIEEMNNIFEKGLKPGIETDTDFKAIRIDRVEHNERIEDQIIAEIIRSKFVVADFTCDDFDVGGIKIPDVRGGVYYEAGFAHGLDKTVIFTCREDCQKHVHFDTSHFNHIFWKDVDDLKTKLNNRIRGTLSLSKP